MKNKIAYRTGDMVSSAEGGFYVHGCNAQGGMGAGIALQIKKQLPSVYTTYHRKWEDGHYENNADKSKSRFLRELEMGSIIPVQTDAKTVWINAITQRYYRGHKSALPGVTRFVSYDAIEDSFAKINLLPAQYPGIPPVLNMPLIGAGLGGGKWDIIEEIVRNTIINLDVVVWTLD